MRPEFAEFHFRDPERAGRTLDHILTPARPQLPQHLVDALRESPDPTLVLDRLERLLEEIGHPNALLDMMDSAPRYAGMMAAVFSQSQFLSDIVFKHPDYLVWLWTEVDLDAPRRREEMTEELLRQVQAVDAFDARCQSIRRFKRREILRIGTRDVFEHASVASVTEDLANLADAALEAALYGAREALAPRFGFPRDAEGRESSFVVLALGKHGGRELNFSSDIDLIFLYSAEGETTGGASGSVANGTYFVKLGELIIKALAENTAEGHVFRVDMRLRPHGRMAPLAVSLETALDYYENYGQAWERQALIKTRPAAGNLLLGQEFIERTRPFVFPRYFDDETLEDIRAVKQQMEDLIRERGQTETEVKLGRGGIRDIEFTVQVLQLLNGGREPGLRTGNTLEAIRLLGEYNILSVFEAATLASNYAFLRQVEHRLQIESSQQRHALPADPGALEQFARRLGFFNSEAFLGEYRSRTRETRAILERFLETEGAGNQWVYSLLNTRGDSENTLPRLLQFGFQDPEKARQQLLALYAGTTERPHSLHIRQQFAAITPMLLHALAACPDPDGTLVRLGRILTSLQAPGALYNLIHVSPHVADYLSTLLSNSEYLSEMILRDPGLFEAIETTDAIDVPVTREALQTTLEELSRAYDAEAAPYRLHNAETLRVGMRELFRGIDVFQVGRELSLIAEVSLDYMLARAQIRAEERFGPASPRFAVLALGKFGGCEMGYGSDLDLVFVYEGGIPLESGMAASEYFAVLASNALKGLKDHTRYGHLYDVDARLRPDGNKGVLAVTDERLADYYLHEAQTWERLALVKVRAVGGDREFGEKVAERARDIAFGAPLTREELAELADMLLKIQAGVPELDLKKRAGGIIEIEFTLRMLQLRHACHHPALRRGDVRGAIEELKAARVLASPDADALLEAYILFRRLENRIRMGQGHSGTSLPATPEGRADLAERLGIAADLLDLVEERRAEVHAVYARSLDALQHEADATA
ncbi:MAG TPA: bifunctional [glutamate--ammonia ligase]-adenylyl-L-tyrosine phosphorylase/[glutamate--ammonia-ligase] adenylyltransferase [Candidatus Hydrogenedentes bacterium]|nr:bifunctional [glutamate--ammonia ligase]-adenylyl-L-tyrosine phosphorylase/[glutamate--ammonia-ligase] adenylyltransferase [Candidatus Hydrogenedentota bacterium]